MDDENGWSPLDTKPVDFKLNLAEATAGAGVGRKGHGEGDGAGAAGTSGAAGAAADEALVVCGTWSTYWWCLVEACIEP